MAKKRTVVKKKPAPFPREIFLVIALVAAGSIISRLDLLGTGPSEGQHAPEIVGALQDGSIAKLSYFKRKVIFLDFWGDW